MTTMNLIKLRELAGVGQQILKEDIYNDIIDRWRKSNPLIKRLEVLAALNDLWYNRIEKNKPVQFADKYDLSLPDSLATLADGKAIRRALRDLGFKRHSAVNTNLRAGAGGQLPGHLDSNIWRRDLEAQAAAAAGASSEVGADVDVDGNVLDYGPGFNPETQQRPVTTRVDDIFAPTGDPDIVADTESGLLAGTAGEGGISMDVDYPTSPGDELGDIEADTESGLLAGTAGEGGISMGADYEQGVDSVLANPPQDDEPELSSSDVEMQKLRDKIAAYEQADADRKAAAADEKARLAAAEAQKLELAQANAGLGDSATDDETSGDDPPAPPTNAELAALVAELQQQLKDRQEQQADKKEKPQEQRVKWTSDPSDHQRWAAGRTEGLQARLAAAKAAGFNSLKAARLGGHPSGNEHTWTGSGAYSEDEFRYHPSREELGYGPSVFTKAPTQVGRENSGMPTTGTAKRGNDVPQQSTKMKADTTKYADTGEAPPVQGGSWSAEQQAAMAKRQQERTKANAAGGGPEGSSDKKHGSYTDADYDEHGNFIGTPVKVFGKAEKQSGPEGGSDEVHGSKSKKSPTAGRVPGLQARLAAAKAAGHATLKDARAAGHPAGSEHTWTGSGA